MSDTADQTKAQNTRIEQLKRYAVSAVHNALADILAEAESPAERREIIVAAKNSLNPI